jgi:hypothetical protein
MIKLTVVSAFGVIPDLPSDLPIGCIIAWYFARILPSKVGRLPSQTKTQLLINIVLSAL